MENSCIFAHITITLNIMLPLQRLTEAYTVVAKSKGAPNYVTTNERKMVYNALRQFCIECELLTFNEIELMEYEINKQYEN